MLKANNLEAPSSRDILDEIFDMASVQRNRQGISLSALLKSKQGDTVK